MYTRLIQTVRKYTQNRLKCSDDILSALEMDADIVANTIISMTHATEQVLFI